MYKYLIIASLAILLGAGCDNTYSNVTSNSTPTAPTSTTMDNNTAPTTTPTAIDMTVPSGTDVDMSARGLTSVPAELINRTDITRLNLSGNKLTGSLPAEVRNLQNLTYLDLSNNQMTGLPAELGQLKKLQVLNVSKNKLTGLPLELGNLTGLQILDVYGNNYSQQDLDKIAALLTGVEIRK
ncbi:MAG: leucine-rich repeat domain-containing protein [Patescibacteria group bacterium]